MTFSIQVRREIAHTSVEKKCCARAELVAAVLCSGGLSFRGMGRYGISIYADSGSTIKRYIEILRRFYHCPAVLQAVETAKLGGQVRYAALIPEDSVPMLLKNLHLLDNTQPFDLGIVPQREILREPCCRQAFLRGAYLVRGSAVNPEKAYHMEFSMAEIRMAECLVQLLADVSVHAGITQRKNQQVVYIKDGDHMARMLTLLGAHKALLEFENLRIYKDIRNDANRQTNCDSANVDKTLAAAERQISMIQFIEKEKGLKSLPHSLEEIARLRLEHPDVSLTELGTMTCPQLGKSGVNARMRKLEAIAETLIGGKS